jgi:hypothetical protein
LLVVFFWVCDYSFFFLFPLVVRFLEEEISVI